MEPSVSAAGESTASRIIRGTASRNVSGRRQSWLPARANTRQALGDLYQGTAWSRMPFRSRYQGAFSPPPPCDCLLCAPFMLCALKGFDFGFLCPRLFIGLAYIAGFAKAIVDGAAFLLERSPAPLLVRRSSSQCKARELSIPCFRVIDSAYARSDGASGSRRPPFRRRQ
jgi:hypothetical protein